MLVPINLIKANPKNPRVIKDHKFEKLKSSIQSFPEMLEKRPLVVFTDKDKKYTVIGGNMRLKAAIEVGIKELPVILADDWTEEQKAEFLVKDNVNFGEWNFDELANEWDADLLNSWGLDLPEFELIAEKELDDLSDKITKTFKIEVDCKDEEQQEKTYNKLIELGYQCRLLTL